MGCLQKEKKKAGKNFRKDLILKYQSISLLSYIQEEYLLNYHSESVLRITFYPFILFIPYRVR